MSLPVDVAEILREELLEGVRPPDGKLHPSVDMYDLRHAQLRYAGFPEKERSTASLVRLETGTMWHERLHQAMRKRGIPIMTEVALEPWLPEGWAGTADWLIFDPSVQAWVLGDIKTVAGVALSFRQQEGMDERHWLQLSAYWHAASRMGIPLVNKVCVVYLPLDDADGADVYVSVDTPGELDEIDSHMDYYLTECKRFAESQDFDCLAPQLERVQKVNWNGKRNAFELKLVPHWLTRYCDFGEDVCGCENQGETKIGEYVWKDNELKYVPRKGYDDIDAEVAPNRGDVRKRFS